MSARKQVNPHRRTQDLIVEDVGEELLIYKLDEHKAVRLNAAAARVWRRCDGERSIGRIARDIRTDVGEPVREELIEYTVARLAKANLLEASNGEMASDLNRRQLLGRLGIAAGALPVIFSLTAPRAYAQASSPCVEGNSGCNGQQCGTPCTPSLKSDPQTCAVKVCNGLTGMDAMCLAIAGVMC